MRAASPRAPGSRGCGTAHAQGRPAQGRGSRGAGGRRGGAGADVARRRRSRADGFEGAIFFAILVFFFGLNVQMFGRAAFSISLLGPGLLKGHVECRSLAPRFGKGTQPVRPTWDVVRADSLLRGGSKTASGPPQRAAPAGAALRTVFARDHPQTLFISSRGRGRGNCGDRPAGRT